MTAPVQLVFLGEVIEGFAVDDVKRALGELFKLDEARLAQMFAGGRVVINRSVAAADAPVHVARFARLGARLHIEPLAGGATPVPAPPAPAAVVHAAMAKAAAAPLAAAPAQAPAEEEIVCPNCGERQSKRLLCRACATNMPMGIAAKLEAAQEARAAALEARQAGRRPASAGRGPRAASSTSSVLWGLGFSGRVGRLAYASVGFIFLAAMLLMTVALLKLPGMSGLVVFGFGLLLIVFLSVRLSALRCHDFNRSGWWSALMLVPYVGGVVGLVLSFMPGSREDNDHGEPPHDGSWALLLGSLAVLAVSAVYSGSALMAAWSSRGFSPGAGEHAAPSEATALSLLRPPARAAYLNEYVGAPGHKAFAISPGGAWGWKSGAASLDDAVDAALATCSANRKPYTPECVPVNVDGAWVPVETE